MSDLFRYAKIAYVKACEEFNWVAKKYNDTHISIQNNGIIEYKSEEALPVFICISNVIHKAIEWYVRIDKSKLAQKQKDLFSGVRHVDNILKHENKTHIEIYDFIRPCPKFEIVRKNGVIKPNVSCSYVFMDIEYIPCDKEYISQRKNYNRFLNGKDVIEIFDQISHILEDNS